jgi:hypothetical protein
LSGRTKTVTPDNYSDEAKSLIESIQRAWGWTGATPQEVIATNAFGNVLFSSADSRVWRLSPEELACSVIAESRDELEHLLRDADFLLDWEMEALVLEAHAKLGAPGDQRCYCLKTPGPLGGSYDACNLGTISIAELIAFSGHVAEQIADLPDGSQAQIVFE